MLAAVGFQRESRVFVIQTAALRSRVIRSTLRRHPTHLAERLSWRLTYFGLELGLVHRKIVLVHVLPRQIEELVFVLPPKRI